jgi:hypothetical protein
MKKEEKFRKIGKLIIMTYKSLESHILWTYKDYIGSKSVKDRKFHIECVKEYAEMIKLLSELF